jgi:hypothetical protein
MPLVRNGRNGNGRKYTKVAEYGSRDPASQESASRNLDQILGEYSGNPYRKLSDAEESQAGRTSFAIRKELREKVHPGFKNGGTVRRTGIYKLHKGEKVLTAKQARSAKRPNSKAIPAVKAVKARRATRARSAGSKRKR